MTVCYHPKLCSYSWDINVDANYWMESIDRSAPVSTALFRRFQDLLTDFWAVLGKYACRGYLIMLSRLEFELFCSNFKVPDAGCLPEQGAQQEIFGGGNFAYRSLIGYYHRFNICSFRCNSVFTSFICRRTILQWWPKTRWAWTDSKQSRFE